MHTKRIIPCLDVNNGRVVKGVNFVDLKDAGDPVEIAKAYDQAGADELVFLDITASSDNRGTVVDWCEKSLRMYLFHLQLAVESVPWTILRHFCAREQTRFPSILRQSIHRISFLKRQTSLEVSV